MSDGQSSWAETLVLNAARRMRFAAQELAFHAGAIAEAGTLLGERLAAGNKILVCGNGGSAACAQHFAAEFTGKLAVDRRPLPAISLTVDTSAMTAIANDWSFEDVFARQVRAHAQPGDVLVGISTSGTSKNVARAVTAAAESGLTSIVLTGPSNGMGGDFHLPVAVRETARIQEVHDLILHELAQIAERVAVPDMCDDASANRFPFVLEEGDLAAFRAWTKDSGQQVVTTNGVFDLLHEGHLLSLGASRARGDRLVVLVNSDASVSALKGPLRPIQDQDLRVRAIERTAIADHVIVMTDQDPIRLLGSLQPDVHCKGSDYGNKPLIERDVVEAHGGRIELLELRPGFSTTRIVERARGV